MVRIHYGGLISNLKVGGSIPPSLNLYGGVAQLGERQTEVVIDINFVCLIFRCVEFCF